MGSDGAEGRLKGSIKSIVFQYFQGAETDVGLFEVHLCMEPVQGVGSMLGREELCQKRRKWQMRSLKISERDMGFRTAN